LNKCDLADGEEDGPQRLLQLRDAIEKLGFKVFTISAATSIGLGDLKERLHAMVLEERRLFEAELASRLPVVKGLMSAAALGVDNHGMLDFSKAIADGRAFGKMG
jgi:50S ribosomal subunit-associated GTPase HflX